MTNEVRDVDVLVERRLARDRQGAYRQARELLPSGVVVRVGRRVFINVERLDAFLAAGGRALPSGWRREPQDPRPAA